MITIRLNLILYYTEKTEIKAYLESTYSDFIQMKRELGRKFPIDSEFF